MIYTSIRMVVAIIVLVAPPVRMSSTLVMFLVVRDGRRILRSMMMVRVIDEGGIEVWTIKGRVVVGPP